MIEAGLLSAVAADAVLGELSELREWGEKSNGRNVGAGLGRREKLDVFAQVGCIMALAEEIGFADGLVGQGTVESESGRSKQQGRSENREAGPDGRGHYANLCTDWMREMVERFRTGLRARLRTRSGGTGGASDIGDGLVEVEAAVAQIGGKGHGVGHRLFGAGLVTVGADT